MMTLDSCFGPKWSSPHTWRRWLLLGIIALQACVGPPALKQAVTGYDETTSQLDQQLLLLNIARQHKDLPIHFTTTSSIAATFDWSTTLGAGAQFEESGADWLNLRLGGSVSEKPTFSIIPLSGEQFTKRVLSPFREEVFHFSVFRGDRNRFDQLVRLMARGIEVQNSDGSFLRVIANDPIKREQYEEFRRIALHLQWLLENQLLFVRRLVFEEVLFDNYKGTPRSQDVAASDGRGLRWRQNKDGSYRLTKLAAGRVVITNYDPLQLSQQQRLALNERIKTNPASFVYLHIRPGDPGGDFPIEGAIKLRSLSQIIYNVAMGMEREPEYAVIKDTRTGDVDPGQTRTLAIDIAEKQPPQGRPNARYGDEYYSVADTRWDRNGFIVLYYLFQTALGEVSNVGIPITIAK